MAQEADRVEAQFLAGAGRGRQLPEYLTAVTQHLSQEHAMMLEEVQRLWAEFRRGAGSPIGRPALAGRRAAPRGAAPPARPRTSHEAGVACRPGPVHPEGWFRS